MQVACRKAILSIIILFFFVPIDRETIQELKLWHDPHNEVDMVLIIKIHL
jgi:hypothetical protein